MQIVAFLDRILGIAYMSNFDIIDYYSIIGIAQNHLVTTYNC